MGRVIIAVLAMALVAAQGAVAQQEEPIATDRPDFTESSSLVPPGRLQLESGWTYTEGPSINPVNSQTWPELLGRLGVSRRLELRVGQSLATVDPGNGGGFTAREDLYVGAKLGIARQRGGFPELAFIVQATVPTGDERLTADEVLPGGAILAGWNTSGRWSFAAGVQFNESVLEGVELGPSVAIGFDASATVKAFGEWFALAPIGNDIPAWTEYYANAGMAILLSPNAQLDGRVGFGLNAVADRVFVGVGFSIRR